MSEDLNTPARNDHYRTAAQHGFHEGRPEVDEGAEVSRPTDPQAEGAYVRAWVWVPDAAAEQAQSKGSSRSPRPECALCQRLVIEEHAMSSPFETVHKWCGVQHESLHPSQW